MPSLLLPSIYAIRGAHGGEAGETAVGRESSALPSDLESNIVADKILLSQDNPVVEPLRQSGAVLVREPQHGTYKQSQTKQKTEQEGLHINSTHS